MGSRPVEAHAALGGIHRLGDAEAEIEQMVAESERFLPVEDRRGGGIARLQRIDDDMSGGEGRAVEGLRAFADAERRAGEPVAVEPARRIRKLDLRSRFSTSQ